MVRGTLTGQEAESPHRVGRHADGVALEPEVTARIAREHLDAIEPARRETSAREGRRAARLAGPERVVVSGIMERVCVHSTESSGEPQDALNGAPTTGVA